MHSGKQCDNENPEYFKDHIFSSYDYVSQIDNAIAFKTYLKAGELMGKITAGTKTYIISLKEFQSKDYGKIGNDICFGSIVRFFSQKNKLVAEFAVGITCENFASPSYIGNLSADVEYKAGKFELTNFSFKEDIE